jgi:hypothetical protein
MSSTSRISQRKASPIRSWNPRWMASSTAGDQPVPGNDEDQEIAAGPFRATLRPDPMFTCRSKFLRPYAQKMRAQEAETCAWSSGERWMRLPGGAGRGDGYEVLGDGTGKQLHAALLQGWFFQDWGKPLRLASTPGLPQERPQCSSRVQDASHNPRCVPLLLHMSLITIRYRCELAHIGPGLAAVLAGLGLVLRGRDGLGTASVHHIGRSLRAVSGFERLV